MDELALDDLFAAARSATDADTAQVHQLADTNLDGLEDVDQDALDRSLRLKAGLDIIRAKGNYDAFAIRCWPEMFTEYGGAVCGPAAMMGESMVPCACEADVYGALSQLVLQEVSGAPVFLTDLVDMDIDDNTGVVWHCGQAPVSMRDTQGGGVVDEVALADSLRRGKLAGAALDVFETEPLIAEAARRFNGLKNLILTPHIAGVTEESNVRVSAMIADRVLENLKSS